MARRLLAAALWVACSGFAGAASVTPSDPVAGEKVLMSTGFCRGGSPTSLASPPIVEVAPGTLRLRAAIFMSDFSVSSCIHIAALSPPLQAGTYDASFIYTIPPNTGGDPQGSPQQLGRITVAPLAAPAAPLHRHLSGNWFDPNRPGTGVNLVQGASGALFAAWLTHPPAEISAPSLIVQGGWLVMSEGMWIAPNVFRGPLFTTRAASVERPWDRTKLSVTPDGFAKFTFFGPDEVRFEAVLLYGVDSNMTVTQTLRRFRF